MVLLAQALTERNPAAHAIWWVAAGIAVVLGMLVVFEIKDWLRNRYRQRSQSRPVQPGEGVDGFHLDEPDSELRERHFRRPGAHPRKWTEGLIEHGRNGPKE